MNQWIYFILSIGFICNILLEIIFPYKFLDIAILCGITLIIMKQWED